MGISLKARLDTSISLEAQVDKFVTGVLILYSLDFSESKNSFYLCLF